MKITTENGQLRLELGRFQSDVSLDIASIESWSLVIDDFGTPYLYFKFDGLVQGITLPTNDVVALKENVERLREILMMEPEIDISVHQPLFEGSNVAVMGVELFFLTLVSIS